MWQHVQEDSQPKSPGLVLGWQPLGAILHSSNEPGELLQWLCHDVNTINIVLDIIIIIIARLTFPASLPRPIATHPPMHPDSLLAFGTTQVFYLLTYLLVCLCDRRRNTAVGRSSTVTCCSCVKTVICTMPPARRCDVTVMSSSTFTWTSRRS